MSKPFIRMLLAAALLPCAATVYAEDYVVIVNKANADALSPEFVEKVYRGEAKNWPSGAAVAPAILPESSATRIAFDKKVLDKTPAQSRGMWAQMTFSGKMVPPKKLDDDAAVLKFVSEEKAAIGYVSPGAAGAGVKVVK